ncbi:MAG: hypothetical protein JW870_00515 [Candidatus Delongbacteria bacterium]|nr:hypothetical protein [Candidatus Delongbacteria bacterium]
MKRDWIQSYTFTQPTDQLGDCLDNVGLEGDDYNDNFNKILGVCQP